MATTVFSVRLSEEYTQRLEAPAVATGRGTNLLVNEAVARYVAEQEAYPAQVQEGSTTLRRAVWFPTRLKCNA